MIAACVGIIGCVSHGVGDASCSVADPSQTERRVWSAFGRGELVDLRSGDVDADDPSHSDEWPGSRRVRAEIIAALMLGAVPPIRGCTAGVRLVGARVEGTVDVRHGIIKYPFELKGCFFENEILFTEARARTVDLSGSNLRSVDASSVVIDGQLRLDRCEATVVTLDGAHITGSLSLDGGCLRNPGGTALAASRLMVDGGMFCEYLQAEGKLRLGGAHIGGPLKLDGAQLKNCGDTALAANGVTVDGGISCESEFQAEGEVQLISANISRQFSLDGACLDNHGGIALAASRLKLEGGMFCRRGFRVNGEIRLPGAHISGQLSFHCAAMDNGDEVALDCQRLQADLIRFISVAVTGKVLLTSAQVRVLNDEPGNWPANLLLDGFTYDDLQPYAPAKSRPCNRGRLAWLECNEHYAAQPYEQLAAYYRRLGQEEEARTVLLAKQRRQRKGLRLPGKSLSLILDVLVGYGYKPSRAFGYLLALLIGGSVYFTLNPPAPLYPAQHPQFQPVLYTANLIIPIVNLGQGGTWQLPATSQWVAAALTVLGWVFATAAVAGLTRVLSRK